MTEEYRSDGSRYVGVIAGEPHTADEIHAGIACHAQALALLFPEKGDEMDLEAVHSPFPAPSVMPEGFRSLHPPERYNDAQKWAWLAALAEMSRPR